jgi:hypothetical protein
MFIREGNPDEKHKLRRFIMKSNSTRALVLSMVFAAVTLVGCDNYTSQSMCENATTGPIEGVTGIYQINTRNTSNFGVETGIIEITDNESKQSYKLKRDDDSEMILCNVGGKYIVESYDEDLKAFSQGRFYVSQVGLHFNPVMYDKVLLDAAGVPNKLVAVPSKMRQIIGEKWSARIDGLTQKLLTLVGEEENMALVIDNSGHSAGQILQYSKPAFYGITLFRK